jgi:hypothetical protein
VQLLLKAGHVTLTHNASAWFCTSTVQPFPVDDGFPDGVHCKKKDCNCEDDGVCFKVDGCVLSHTMRQPSSSQRVEREKERERERERAKERERKRERGRARENERERERERMRERG